MRTTAVTLTLDQAIDVIRTLSGVAIGTDSDPEQLADAYERALQRISLLAIAARALGLETGAP